MQLETIAAIVTPPLASAVGVVRLSGVTAFETADKLFAPADKKPLSKQPPRYMVYGGIMSSGRVIDKAMAVRFEAPNSYTGENVVEFFCHGGLFLVSEVQRLCLKNGARAAEAGEFTKRAFLNGKTDLSAAEAVGDIISADNQNALFNAASQLSGRLAKTLREARNKAVNIAADFSAWIDFVDEGVEPPDINSHIPALRELSSSLEALASTYAEGRVIREGVRCAIIGRPNVGKSSVLNHLLGYSRSIVTDIPGTTRDMIEAETRLGGLTLKLIDTAGIRLSDDCIESMGVALSREAAKTADLVLVVVDGSVPLTGEDHDILETCANGCKLVIRNKKDLGLFDQGIEGLDPIALSAKTGEGFDELERRISELFFSGSLRPDGGIIVNARQQDALIRAAASLKSAAVSLEQGFTPDIAQTELFLAIEALGEITGETASIEVINDIFSRFCVGK